MRKTLVKIRIVFGGDWPWPSRSNLTSKSKFTPFWACPWDNSSPVCARTTKFGPEVQNTLVKISIVLGVHWAWHIKFNLFSKSYLFASLLRLWNIGETRINIWKTESVPHMRTNMFAHSVVSWTVEQSGCIFSVTIAGFPVLDSAIGNGFLMLLDCTYLTCLNFLCQHSVMVETTLKPRAFAFIVSYFPTCIGKPGAIFSARVNIGQTSSVVIPGFRQTVFTFAEKLALVAFWLFPHRPLWFHATECCVCRFKSVPTWWLCGPISACTAC